MRLPVLSPPTAFGRRRTTICSMALTTIQRSEEHTSELPSQSNLVCRLLLEKKKPGIISQYLSGNSVQCPGRADCQHHAAHGAERSSDPAAARAPGSVVSALSVTRPARRRDC